MKPDEPVVEDDEEEDDDDDEDDDKDDAEGMPASCIISGNFWEDYGVF